MAPDRTARRARWNEVEYAALDFETTGLDLGKDTIVSFGAVPVRAGRVVASESVHQLVRPHIPPSPRSQTIHGLRPQDLADAPGLDEAREALRAALEGRYLVAWYAEIELAFLGAIFGGGSRRWARRCIDVAQLVVALDLEEGRSPDFGARLTTAAARFGVPVASPHDALDDAMVAAQLFIVVAAKLEASGTTSVAGLLRAGRVPRPLA